MVLAVGRVVAVRLSTGAAAAGTRSVGSTGVAGLGFAPTVSISLDVSQGCFFSFCRTQGS